MKNYFGLKEVLVLVCVLIFKFFLQLFLFIIELNLIKFSKKIKKKLFWSSFFIATIRLLLILEKKKKSTKNTKTCVQKNKEFSFYFSATINFCSIFFYIAFLILKRKKNKECLRSRNTLICLPKILDS